MRLSLWGVRGSIATPGPTTVRYGGNTTCLMVETDDRHVVLDAGTGIYPLGVHLMKGGVKEIDILITHSHMDHIVGFPFFAPLYNPQCRVSVYGKVHYEKTVGEVLASQMDYSYFPLRAAELPAKVVFRDLEGADLELGATRVRSMMVNHPVLMQAYRVECGGKTVAFSGDMEPYYDTMDSAEGLAIATSRNRAVVDFFRGSDVFVCDATYTPVEYASSKKGWGHCSLEHAVWFGGEAGVRHLVLTHHEPGRDDAQVDALLTEAQGIARRLGYRFASITMGREGQVIEA